MAESADATDLKSVGGNTVRVRPPLAPFSSYYVIARSILRDEAIQVLEYEIASLPEFILSPSNGSLAMT